MTAYSFLGKPNNQINNMKRVMLGNLPANSRKEYESIWVIFVDKEEEKCNDFVAILQKEGLHERDLTTSNYWQLRYLILGRERPGQWAIHYRNIHDSSEVLYLDSILIRELIISA